MFQTLRRNTRYIMKLQTTDSSIRQKTTLTTILEFDDENSESKLKEECIYKRCNWHEDEKEYIIPSSWDQCSRCRNCHQCKMEKS